MPYSEKKAEAEYKRKYYLANKEQFVEKAKVWKKNNKAKVLARQRAYYHENLEKKRAYYRERRKRIIDYTKTYYRENKDSFIAASRISKKTAREELNDTYVKGTIIARLGSSGVKIDRHEIPEEFVKLHATILRIRRLCQKLIEEENETCRQSCS